MENIYNEFLSLLTYMLNTISSMTTEQIALFSIFISLLIFSLGKRYELKLKRHELKKEQYLKFLKLIEEIFSKTKELKSKQTKANSNDIQTAFFDLGSSLMLFGSKKLYRQYVFYREFNTNPSAQFSKYYDESLNIYILSKMFKTMRKEVGLNYINNISDVEILGFFINDIANNPRSKISSFKANFHLQMIKIEIFIFDRIYFVLTKKIFYSIFAPILGLIGLLIKYMIMIPLGKFLKWIAPNIISKFDKADENLKSKINKK